MKTKKPKRVQVAIKLLPENKKKMKVLAARDDMKLQDKYDEVIGAAK